VQTKPKVAIYYFVIPQTNFRNDGPPLFINYNLRKILNGDTNMADNTRNVIHCQPTGDISHIGTPDLHVLVDHGEDALGVPLDFEYPHPNAYWVSDAHLGYKYRLERAREFDFVFCAQKAFIDQFAADGIPKEKLFYLPHAVEPDIYKPLSVIEKWDWSFIGHLNSPQRIDLLDRFCKELPNWYLGWRNPQVPGYNVLDDVNVKFNKSRLVLNISIKEDLNMRVFEALGSKRVLLTDKINEMDGIFESGTHLVAYESIDQAVALANEFLADDKRRAEIAEQGYKQVISGPF